LISLSVTPTSQFFAARAGLERPSANAAAPMPASTEQRETEFMAISSRFFC